MLILSAIAMIKSLIRGDMELIINEAVCCIFFAVAVLKSSLNSKNKGVEVVFWTSFAALIFLII